MTRRLLLLLAALLPWHDAEAQTPDSFLRPNDVIALVGGEDMVGVDEFGLLELLLQRARPEHHFKVRCLAWEGDTVFSQPRMLNYPTLEHQLDEIGASVVLMQFGQMESLAGPDKLSQFTTAYAKLIERLAGTNSRRVAIITPTPFNRSGTPQWEAMERSRVEYTKAIPATITTLAPSFDPNSRNGIRPSVLGQPIFSTKANIPATIINLTDDSKEPRSPFDPNSRDGVHLSLLGQPTFSMAMLTGLLPKPYASAKLPIGFPDRSQKGPTPDSRLLDLIRAKNRLWNNYRRPQNWAFLAGDRTEQPSSRDHIDRNKRWFPEEMKQWLPLIEAKENEIWKLAAELADK